MKGLSMKHGDKLPRFEVMEAEGQHKGISIFIPEERDAFGFAMEYARHSQRAVYVIDRCGGMSSLQYHEVWEFDPKIVEMGGDKKGDPIVMMVTRKISLRGKMPLYWTGGDA